MGVPQQDPQVALGLPPHLVGEEEAEWPGVGRQNGAHEPGSLLLRLWAGVYVQIGVELWRGEKYIRMRDDFVLPYISMCKIPKM